MRRIVIHHGAQLYGTRTNCVANDEIFCARTIIVSESEIREINTCRLIAVVTRLRYERVIINRRFIARERVKLDDLYVRRGAPRR